MTQTANSFLDLKHWSLVATWKHTCAATLRSEEEEKEEEEAEPELPHADICFCPKKRRIPKVAGS